jgi:RNA polymerase sigma factor (sigma-70 family)
MKVTVTRKPIPPESLAELLAKYGNLVRRTIQKRLRGSAHHNIDDVAQETQLRLLRLLPGKHIEDLDAYICAVATNAVIDFVTNDSQSRERMGFDTDELERFFELMPNGWVEDPQITAEREQELARITKHLPRHLKATLFLCERDGMTYEEAGKKLGKSPNTVKKWLADARAHCQVRANRR